MTPALYVSDDGGASWLKTNLNPQVFLGSARDYTVRLDDETELRVTAPPGQNIAPGETVWLQLPAEKCRALAED